MTQAVTLTGKVSGGRLPPHMAGQLADAVAELDGKTVEVTVKERKKRRSNNQNAYYWGVVVRSVTQMFRHAGNYVDDEEVHEFLKLRVGKLSRVVVDPDGVVHKTLGSTAKLGTMEFEAYMETVRAWAAGFGKVIPLPNEEFSPTTEGNQP